VVVDGIYVLSLSRVLLIKEKQGLLLQVQLFINHVKYLQTLLFEMSSERQIKYSSPKTWIRLDEFPEILTRV